MYTKKRVKRPKNLINLDLCAISIKGNFEMNDKKGIIKFGEYKQTQIKLTGRGQGVYKNHGELYHKGELIGIMQCSPNELIPKNYAMLKINNRLLYTRFWTDKVKEVLKDLSAKINHVNQIDIALDQVDNDSFKFIRLLSQNKLKLKGNSSYDVRYKQNGVKTNIQYARFGARSSNKFMRCYYKRQELAKSNKQYIQEYWDNNKLDYKDKEVARFEIVLKRRELSQYHDVFEKYKDIDENNLELLEDTEYLKTLYLTGTKNFFEFCKMKAYIKAGKKFDRCKSFNVIEKITDKVYLLQKIRSKATTLIWSAKITCKQLYFIYLRTGSKNYWYQIREILANYNLKKWLDDAIDRWDREFELKVKKGFKDFQKIYICNEFASQLQIVKSDAYEI